MENENNGVEILKTIEQPKIPLNKNKIVIFVIAVIVIIFLIGLVIFINKGVKNKNLQNLPENPTEINKQNDTKKLSDETINSLINTLKYTEFKGQTIETGFVGANKFTKGDLNNDGFEDVIFVETYCGASCGSSLSTIINQGDGTGKLQDIKQDKYILTSSAAQTEITNIEFDNGTITITANGFKGETDWNKSITKKFIIEDGELKEVSDLEVNFYINEVLGF